MRTFKSVPILLLLLLVLLVGASSDPRVLAMASPPSPRGPAARVDPQVWADLPAARLPPSPKQPWLRRLNRQTGAGYGPRRPVAP